MGRWQTDVPLLEGDAVVAKGNPCDDHLIRPTLQIRLAAIASRLDLEQERKTMMFIAVKKWKDGSETTMEYFTTQAECLAWIAKQRQPVGDEFVWCVGEY
jgi:hypothetical protein